MVEPDTEKYHVVEIYHLLWGALVEWMSQSNEGFIVWILHGRERRIWEGKMSHLLSLSEGNLF